MRVRQGDMQAGDQGGGRREQSGHLFLSPALLSYRGLVTCPQPSGGGLSTDALPWLWVPQCASLPLCLQACGRGGLKSFPVFLLLSSTLPTPLYRVPLLDSPLIAQFAVLSGSCWGPEDRGARAELQSSVNRGRGRCSKGRGFCNGACRAPFRLVRIPMTPGASVLTWLLEGGVQGCGGCHNQAHRLGGRNNRNSFPLGSGGGGPRSRCWSGCFPSGAALPGL